MNFNYIITDFEDDKIIATSNSTYTLYGSMKELAFMKVGFCVYVQSALCCDRYCLAFCIAEHMIHMFSIDAFEECIRSVLKDCVYPYRLTEKGMMPVYEK